MENVEQVQSDDDIVQVNALVTRKRREVLKRKAVKANMTISELVDQMIGRTQVVAVVDKKLELQRLNSWLGRINSNINMISKHANIFKEASDAALMQLRLTQIRDDLRHLLEVVTK